MQNKFAEDYKSYLFFSLILLYYVLFFFTKKKTADEDSSNAEYNQISSKAKDYLSTEGEFIKGKISLSEHIKIPSQKTLTFE